MLTQKQLQERIANSHIYLTSALPWPKKEKQMETSIVAIFDKKTGLFGPPAAVRHVGDAVRDWDNLRKDTNTKFGKHPEDFDLFKIGEYNDQSGKLSSINPHLHLASGV